MRKQIAIVTDASGSMFHPAGNDCAHDKIIEASESVKYMLEEIKNHVRSTGDEWAVSLWYFASSFSGLVGQTMFSSAIQDFTVNVMKNVVTAIENQSSTQSAVGNLTDIFGAIRQTSDWLEALPPTWPSFPTGGPPDKRVIVFFSDGNQTISHNGARDRAGYEAEQGVTFLNLLQGRNIILNTQGIGSDLLNATMTDLASQGVAPESTSKVISTTPGYSADCSAVLLTNSLKVVNDNGVLKLRPVGGTESGLLWEQFSLPTTGIRSETEALFLEARVNHKEFEVELDGVSNELILGLTWHQAGSPTVEATSPSGNLFKDGVGGAYLIKEGWMLALHVPQPEEGTWNVRVLGDPKFAPIRLNLMARGINPRFKLWVKAVPTSLAQAGKAKIVAEPRFEDRPAGGKLKATATVFGGKTVNLAEQQDGTFVGDVEIKSPGVNPARVEVTGKLGDGTSVDRLEFTTVQLGRASDPRLRIQPDKYEQGQAYTVDIQIRDAAFNRATQIRFGDGILVKRFIVLSDIRARAEIDVSPGAPVGGREVVTFMPDAETLAGVEVVAGEKDGRRVTGRICCLRFDAAGKLVGVVLCDGTKICVGLHDERIQKILETARGQNLAVKVYLDSQGCLTEIEICR